MLLIIWMKNGYAFYDFSKNDGSGFCVTRQVARANNYTIKERVNGETFIVSHNVSPILLFKAYVKKIKHQTMEDVDIRLINPLCLDLR